MRNRTGFVCLERPDNLESLGKNPNLAIVTAKKQIIRTGGDGAEVVTLAMSASGRNTHIKISN